MIRPLGLWLVDNTGCIMVDSTFRTIGDIFFLTLRIIQVVHLIPPYWLKRFYFIFEVSYKNFYFFLSEQQGIILGSFFYGYITTQLLGGYLADRFGAKILFGVGVGCTAIFTVITAPIARLGFGWMIALRKVVEAK